MRPWFERDPELLARELAALEELGARLEIDEAARAEGLMRLLIDYPSSSGFNRLIGLYPDLYPFFRPEVIAPELSLSRHQQPNSKALCLIGRRTSRWYVEDTLASLLSTQLASLLVSDAQPGTDAPLIAEERQGEPVSDYYNGEAPPESYLLFDGAWKIDAAVNVGTFTARVRKMPCLGKPELTFQGYITEVRGAEQEVLAQWTGPAIPGITEQIEGRWLRQDQPVLGDINQVVESLGEDSKWLMNEKLWPNQRHFSMSALLFPEEVQHLSFADGWAAIQWGGSRRQRGQARQITGRFVRVSRAGVGDLAARMPATASLQNRSAALFGVGAVGAPVALELARAGIGRLLLVDHDMVDPATIRRWPFGVSAFGARKVQFLKEHLALDYPWTQVEIDTMQIGAIEEASPEKPQGERLEMLLADRDLIIDCTAELGVNHLLSELARARNIPYLLGNATPGAWGGMVASFKTTGTCWLCLRHALYVDASVPMPPADQQGELQPPGCADPTFTGAAFDLTEVSLEVVRTAAGMLSQGEAGYPEADRQLGILRLRAPDGSRVGPVWDRMAIPVRPYCGCAG